LVTSQAQAEVHLTSSAPTANYYEIVSQLGPATNISSHDANWEDYEDLLDPLGEANGPPISDNEVELQALTRISAGENQLIFEGLLPGRRLGNHTARSLMRFRHRQTDCARSEFLNSR